MHGPRGWDAIVGLSFTRYARIRAVMHPIEFIPISSQKWMDVWNVVYKIMNNDKTDEKNKRTLK
jgi:hypothetical protein